MIVAPESMSAPSSETVPGGGCGRKDHRCFVVEERFPVVVVVIVIDTNEVKPKELKEINRKLFRFE
ncbi:hypothetical protein AALP_AA2G100000 [Arabis alpina]|uniref:Uncharacterized protein n=1 Tax=Arabis alpina TaxID=50452 RepID=A0A087HGG1_ARAAL|nr:hypothetical protein AALP_AA2G100000 [Arabis alpina]